MMTFSRFVVQVALTISVFAEFGCGSAARQCTSDADCTALGDAFAGAVCTANVCVPTVDPKWGCIAKVAALPSGGMTMFKMQMLDLISNDPVTQNLAVKLCNKNDPTCSSPLGSLSPDATGTVSATVASDFDGYLDVTDTTGNYVASLIFIDLAVVAQNGQTSLMTRAAEAGLAAGVAATIDPTAALLLAGTVDCTGARSAGVGVGLSPTAKETAFYLQNMAPTTTATMTDSGGAAGFINVAAPATVTLTGTVAATNREMGKVTTVVRAGSLTYTIVRPTTTL